MKIDRHLHEHEPTTKKTIAKCKYQQLKKKIQNDERAKKKENKREQLSKRRLRRRPISNRNSF